MAIDNDEQFERMCSRCKDEVTSDKKCTRCGKDIATIESCVNPNFDRDRFDRLNEDADEHVVSARFDEDKYHKLDK